MHSGDAELSQNSDLNFCIAFYSVSYVSDVNDFEDSLGASFPKQSMF